MADEFEAVAEETPADAAVETLPEEPVVEAAAEPAPESDANESGEEAAHEPTWDDEPKLSEADNVDHNDAAVSAAPPRDHANLLPQLAIKWRELKDFVRTLEGSTGGELGDVLAFVRSKL